MLWTPMRIPPRYRPFAGLAALTVLLWVLRGLGLLGFLPSGVLFLMLMLSSLLALQAIYFPRRWY